VYWDHLCINRTCILTIPTILFQHDLIEYYVPNQVWYKLLFRKLSFPITLRLVDKIVCVSHNTLNDINKIFKISKSKLELIYNGVDVKIFDNIDKKYAKKILLEEHNINYKYLLYVGTITEPQKNLVRLIKAFSLLKESGEKIKLVLVGNNSKGSNLVHNEIINQNLINDVYHAGYVSDENLKYFFSCAELFTFPSLYEGFGLPVLEAMACGCPCLTSNNSSLGGIAKDAAILVDPKNVQSIYLGMKQFFNDPNLKNKLVINGKKKSRQFNWITSGKKLHNLVETFNK